MPGKLEIRISKHETNPKIKFLNAQKSSNHSCLTHWDFSYSYLFRMSSFEIRISPSHPTCTSLLCSSDSKKASIRLRNCATWKYRGSAKSLSIKSVGMSHFRMN